VTSAGIAVAEPGQDLVTQEPIVNIHNEWDQLQEIIVGRLEGLLIPSWEPDMLGCMYEGYFDFYKTRGGDEWPAAEIKRAQKELDELISILEGEGVTVRRPDFRDYSKPLRAPHWQASNELGVANPRDSILVVGNDIIETPMAWRSRYFETFAFRSLIKEYYEQGANWISAPKPELTDGLYRPDFAAAGPGEEPRFVLNELEPVFDAADVIKCGRDLFVGLSSTCNEMGIEWLRRYLDAAHPGTYRVHRMVFNDPHAMHIDATFYPIAPGKLLVHPDRVTHIPSMFKGWDVLKVPEPCIPDSFPLYFSSRWMNTNVLMLDESRVIATAGEVNTIRAFKSWGLEVIECPFWNFNNFGGSFHCATLDIRRSGTLQSYF
jgi:glycine amidinotransferase